MAKRYVKQNASGSWDVLKEGYRRSTVQAESKGKAVARARTLVGREGGGEVRVMNQMGKIMDSSKVSARSAKTAGRRRATGSAVRAAKRR
ncbi:MAG: DUF2188 domain-containing protein [Solirubrobacterales bacterium]